MSTKIYSWHGNPRGDICRIAAEFAKVEYEFVNTPMPETKSEQFLAKHPLGKVPLVETPEGQLFETNAILKHFCRQAGLLGTSVFEEAQVQQWLDYTNSTFLKSFFGVYGSVIGFFPFDENNYKQARQNLFAELKYVNDYLNHHTYLAGEALSAADICLFVWVAPLFWTVLDEGFRRGHFSLVRWYKHLLSFAPIKKFYRAPFMCKTAWFNVKTEKKAAAPKQEKKAAPKQEKKAEQKVEEPKPAKKEGDPLDNLPPSSFNLFDFKTFIVNEKDKKKAVAEFWKQFDPQGYSIWHVKYDKYEGEGVKLFLTSNLKDNTLQRLDKFRKHAYGTFGVYGDEGNYEIEGVWVWRGTEIPAQLKELANFEYHFWNRLDHTSEKDRQLLEEFWTGYEVDVSKANGLIARDVTQFK